MESRPATRDDLPAITELHRRVDTGWFGSPEHDQGEVAEVFERVDPLAEHSRLLFDAERLVAAAYWWSTEAVLIVDPDADRDAAHADLLEWYATQPVDHVDVLGNDAALRTAAERRGWRHKRSAFELIRDLSSDWRPAAAVWPAGVRATALAPDDAAALYELIYTDAGWAEIDGHEQRPFEEWRGIFLTAEDPPEQQVLAWRDDALVGAAIGRTFSDGTGWVAQLAVGRRERGVGLGRALLLEAFDRRMSAGAKALGLSVMAENRNALALYLGIGLEIDREWMAYTRR